MRLSVSFVALAISISGVLACGDGHVHNVAKRATPSVITPPSSPLVWGDLNILHTTDSHGWLLGHQKKSSPEPNYSGDLGDFSSFVTHMKEIARLKDVDFLLVDSGDLHDGNGLTDGFPAGGIDAHDANKYVLKLPYDIMAIGNHELYNYTIAYDMHTSFAPHLNGKYLASNADITVGNVTTPVGGNRFRKFTTAKGRKVTALGVLYNFAGFDKGLSVTKVADMVQQSWFTDAIADCPDFFLLVGHMPVSKDNWPVVFNAIRAHHPTVPILILGGHTHIRDCVQYDGRSMALESGRYFETVGFMSVNLPPAGQYNTGNLTFNRRYLDPNRVTYEYHTKRELTFDTFLGLSITKGLKQIAKNFNLGFLFGTAPQDYRLSAVPYTSESSLPRLFIEQVVPTALAINNTRAAQNIPAFFIANSGSQRFDLYAGPFTKNDQLVVSPFLDSFQYLQGVKLGDAKAVLNALNGGGSLPRRSVEAETELYARGSVDQRYNEWLESMDKRVGVERRAAGNLTSGYVTQDSCPGVGDDTLHAPIPYYSDPNYIGSIPPNVTDDTPVDFVFVDFIGTGYVIPTLNKVQKAKNYTAADIGVYSPYTTNQVFGLYAQKAWN